MKNRRGQIALWVLVVVLVLAVAGPAGAGPKKVPKDTTPPTTPTNLVVTGVTQTSASLTWNASTDNSGSFYYVVWGDGLGGVQAVQPPARSITFAGLKPGTTYHFRVQAWDAAYNSSGVTGPVAATTLADTSPPTAPSGLTVQTVDGSKVLLRFTAGTDTIGLVRHEVLVDGAVTPNAMSTVTPGTFPRPSVQGAWVRQLDPSRTYTFTVRAIDASGNVSAASNAAQATTGPNSDTVAPTTPTLTRVSNGGNGSCPEELWIRGTASTDDVDPAGLIEYEVRINGTINEVLTGGIHTVAYTEVLGANTVTIVAVDTAGNASAPSNAMTEHTNWAPGGCGQ